MVQINKPKYRENGIELKSNPDNALYIQKLPHLKKGGKIIIESNAVK